jgi:hypothetical protein
MPSPTTTTTPPRPTYPSKSTAKPPPRLSNDYARPRSSPGRANDILRAAGLTAAALEDPGVMKDLIKVIEGKRLSPVLVVSGDGAADIADGYHRVSLVYRIDPYGDIPLKLA